MHGDDTAQDDAVLFLSVHQAPDLRRLRLLGRGTAGPVRLRPSLLPGTRFNCTSLDLSTGFSTEF